MKLENFKQASELVSDIEKLNEKISYFEKEPVIRFMQPNICNTTFMTVGAWSNCEHELSTLATEFVAKSIAYYKNKRANKIIELELL